MEETLLDRYRAQLDNVDSEIIYLIKRRFQVTQKIAKYKKENNMEIYQPSRENEIFNKISSKAITMKIDENFIQDLFGLIIDESKKQQEKIYNKD
jgi:chorismate mutase